MILLTGATGYLGSGIARELAARRVAFRVLVRSRSRLTFDAAAAGAEVVEGDIRDTAAVARALQGVDRVIHSAALVKMWVRDPAEFHRVNVDGLKALLEAARQAGVERVVYTSSFIALGPSSDPSVGEGLQHHGPYSNEYERTKVEALAWLRQEGFSRYPVLALMPGVIYGPGPMTEGNLVGGMVVQYLAGKFPGLLGSGNQRWSFAFNADVVAAHLAALERGQPGEEYVLAGDNRPLNELFDVIAELSGVRRRVRHLPFAAGKIVGALELAKASVFGRSPQLTPGVVEIFKHDWIYSSAKAERELGYHLTRLEDGMKEVLESKINR